MPLTDYTNNALFTLFENGYLALYTTAPTFTDPGVEVVGGSYARQVVTMEQDVADPSAYDSTNDVVFVNMPECDVVAVGQWDSGEANLIYYTELPEPVHFNAGDDASLLTGQYVVTVA